MLISVISIPLLLASGPGLLQAAGAGTPPAAGDRAPDFSLPYATADTTIFQGPSLDDAVKAGTIVLAFYPADWSPGCTKEVCTFRDSFTDLASLHANVWGISGDQVFCHRAWAQFHKLPFRLLADNKHDVARSYGVFDEKMGFNHRSVFVVGTNGNVLYANPNYSVADAKDFDALKAALQGMKEGPKAER